MASRPVYSIAMITCINPLMMIGFKAQLLLRMEVFEIYSTHKAFMNVWCTEASIERLTLSLTWNDISSEENVYIFK